MPSELGRVRQVARQDKDVRFTALLHHVDVDRLPGGLSGAEAGLRRVLVWVSPGSFTDDGLDALATGILRKKVSWVLDADFRDYFSTLDHQWLERFLEHRIADKRVLRLIQKWLAAGVIEMSSGIVGRAAAAAVLARPSVWRASGT